MDIKKYLGFMNEEVIEVTNKVNRQFLNNMWYNVIDGNPVVSGLSKFSWHMVRGEKTGFKPTLNAGYKYGDGRVFKDPPKPKVLRTGITYKTYVMFNNQDYVTGLNDADTSRYYFGFIDDGIRKAVLQTDINNKVNISGVRDA